MAYDAVVLIGPPGSGKSHLGRQLRAAGICAYRELEPVLIRRFGSGREFAARKDAALAFIERSYRAQMARSARPVALESTGYSDGPILKRLAERRQFLWVRLDAPADLCAARIASRPRGRNLSNDVDHNRRLHAFWTQEIAPGWRFDLAVDATDAAGAAEAIARRLGDLPPGT